MFERKIIHSEYSFVWKFKELISSYPMTQKNTITENNSQAIRNDCTLVSWFKMRMWEFVWKVIDSKIKETIHFIV